MDISIEQPFLQAIARNFTTADIVNFHQRASSELLESDAAPDDETAHEQQSDLELMSRPVLRPAVFRPDEDTAGLPHVFFVLSCSVPSAVS